LRAAGVRVYRTDRDGTVRVRPRPDGGVAVEAGR
jgi:beta-lactamase superfamily II metal-dependent hydrolase